MPTAVSKTKQVFLKTRRKISNPVVLPLVSLAYAKFRSIARSLAIHHLIKVIYTSDVLYSNTKNRYIKVKLS